MLEKVSIRSSISMLLIIWAERVPGKHVLFSDLLVSVLRTLLWLRYTFLAFFRSVYVFLHFQMSLCGAVQFTGPYWVLRGLELSRGSITHAQKLGLFGNSLSVRHCAGNFSFSFALGIGNGYFVLRGWSRSLVEAQKPSSSCSIINCLITFGLLICLGIRGNPGCQGW